MLPSYAAAGAGGDVLEAACMASLRPAPAPRHTTLACIVSELYFRLLPDCPFCFFQLTGGSGLRSRACPTLPPPSMMTRSTPCAAGSACTLASSTGEWQPVGGWVSSWPDVWEHCCLLDCLHARTHTHQACQLKSCLCCLPTHAPPPCRSGLCSALKSGLDALGVHCAEVPRNCLNADCGGHCCLGCARGYKQVRWGAHVSQLEHRAQPSDALPGTARCISHSLPFKTA